MNPTTAEKLAAALAEQAEIRRTGEAAAAAPNVLRFRASSSRDLFATDSAPAPGPAAPAEEDLAAALSLDDVVAYLPDHKYIFLANGKHWPKETINATIRPQLLFDTSGQPVFDAKGKQKTIAASLWLDNNKPVHDMTWAPGEPPLIQDRMTSEGGWFEALGRTTFNVYKPPTLQPCAGDASPWINHVRRLYGEYADHIIKWLAHRVQRPAEKVNHAIVLGGNPGVGKDTILEPVKDAIGAWNFCDVGPAHLFEPFNGFIKSVILRINEVHNLGDVDRYGFYEGSKTYTAAPPTTLRCNEKHLRQFAVFNVCGVVMTTNHLSGGMYLPANDRRHFVAWSDLTSADFPADYWTTLYAWFANSGNETVAHYLATLDLSGFDPKAPPPKTPAFWTIVDSSRAPEQSDMADTLDKMMVKNETTGVMDPRPAVSLGDIKTHADAEFKSWLINPANRTKIAHRLRECGYDAFRNPDDLRDGQWRIGGKRQPVYVLRELSIREKHEAVTKITTPPSRPATPNR